MNQTFFTNDPQLSQTYNGLEITLTKRMSNRWQMLAGYTWSQNRIEGISVNTNPNNLINSRVRLDGIHAAGRALQRAGRSNAIGRTSSS